MNLNIPDIDAKRVVIIGGGFAGLNLAQKLSKSTFQVVLLDKNNYNQFPPLFYQVASAGLEATAIAFPYRKILQNHKNFYFRLAEVLSMDMPGKTVHTTIGDLSYDYLVIAAGTTTNFFGNQHVIDHAYPMKSVEDAALLRNGLLSNFERAIICEDPIEKQALLNVVVVGRGPSGVEIAGALSEMKRFIMHKDYPDLGTYQLNIYLVEGEPKVLANMSSNASEHAEKYLRKMGVEMILGKRVTDYDGQTVAVSDGITIQARTLVWVSGVTAPTFRNIDKDMLGKGGRFLVDEYNQVQGTTHVFAIGDIALCLKDPDYPKGHPQLAQVAIQQGKLLAKNLKRMTEGKTPDVFHYKDLGTLATIGRNKAVADLGKIKLEGLIAWMIWLFVHLRSLLGVKNKFIVLLDWISNYMTYDKGERFIMYLPEDPEKSAEKKK